MYNILLQISSFRWLHFLLILFLSGFFLLAIPLVLSISLKKKKKNKKMNHDHQHLLYPCLHCQPRTYIRMVQHLIERCLLLHMSRSQCIKALADHGNIRPLVTLTVWRELQKENRDFFEAYHHSISSRLFTRRYIQRPRFGRRKQRM